MTPTIHLALTHDWELRGDGSGDIERIQLAPLRKLLEIYAKYGVRTTFLPDVMQQLVFRRFQTKHPELTAPAQSWDEHVREAFRQGHDIQLHLHPQWNEAEYVDGRWRLKGDWSIINYDRETASTMLAECKQYLENLLSSIDENYSCIAFRAGALAAAPSDHLFESLVTIGVQLDVSIAPGLFVSDHNLTLDYRHCEEDFLPYFPMLKDARFVSPRSEPIVCIPLNHFHGSRRAVARQNVSKLRNRIGKDRPGALMSQDKADARNSPLSLAFEKLVKPAVKRKYFVSDTSRLSWPLMREMLAAIRRRARESELARVPVVLTNHPKDIQDWTAIEEFIKQITEAEDVRFITLAELANSLRNGEFKVRTA